MISNSVDLWNKRTHSIPRFQPNIYVSPWHSMTSQWKFTHICVYIHTYTHTLWYFLKSFGLRLTFYFVFVFIGYSFYLCICIILFVIFAMLLTEHSQFHHFLSSLFTWVKQKNNNNISTYTMVGVKPSRTLVKHKKTLHTLRQINKWIKKQTSEHTFEFYHAEQNIPFPKF